MTKEEAIKHLHTYSSTNGSGLTTQDQHEEAKKMAIKALETQPGWIPCSERLPDAEKTVLVTVEVRPKGFMHYKKVVKAFYESGNMTEDDSAYTWYNCDNLVENENGEYVVPEGWWEDVDYAEEFTAIDDCVTAWMPLPTPYREGGQ